MCVVDGVPSAKYNLARFIEDVNAIRSVTGAVLSTLLYARGFLASCQFMLEIGFCAARDLEVAYSAIVTILTDLNMDIWTFKQRVVAAVYFQEVPMCVVGGPTRNEDRARKVYAIMANDESVEDRVDHHIGHMAQAASMGSRRAIEAINAFFAGLSTFDGLGPYFIAKACAENIRYCDSVTKDDKTYFTKSATLGAVGAVLRGGVTWAQNDEHNLFMLRLCLSRQHMDGPFAPEIAAAIAGELETTA